MIKARDIMTREVVTVTEQNTLQDVVELLSKHRFGGLPVVDENYRLKGVISVTDIVHYSEKIDVVPLVNLSGWVSPYADTNSLFYLRKGEDALNYTMVGDIMRRKVFTAKEDQPLNEVARLMKRRRINRVPIVDHDHILVGIVTRSDIVQGISQLEDFVEA